VSGAEADVFDLVAGRGFDLGGDDFGDLFGDPATGTAAPAVAASTAAVAFAAVASTAAPDGERAEGARPLTETADGLPGAFA
jgi:hypothetical protein